MADPAYLYPQVVTVWVSFQHSGLLASVLGNETWRVSRPSPSLPLNTTNSAHAQKTNEQNHMQGADKLQMQALIQFPVGEDEKTRQKSIQASCDVYSTTETMSSNASNTANSNACMLLTKSFIVTGW